MTRPNFDNIFLCPYYRKDIDSSELKHKKYKTLSNDLESYHTEKMERNLHSLESCTQREVNEIL